MLIKNAGALQDMSPYMHLKNAAKSYIPSVPVISKFNDQFVYAYLEKLHTQTC